VRLAMPMQRSQSRTVFAGLAICLLLVLVGCQASMDQKRGGSGELCNGNDTQCREGLVCEEGVCQSINNSEEVCPRICEKFEQCNAGMENCYQDCMATLKEWGEETTQTYADCYESQVSCSEIQQSDAPQNICYARLELPETREERCKTLRDTAGVCLANAEQDYDGQIDNFYDSCRRRGRTVGDQRWQATDSCEEHATASTPRCGQMFACINDNFRMQEDFPTQDPN